MNSGWFCCWSLVADWLGAAGAYRQCMGHLSAELMEDFFCDFFFEVLVSDWHSFFDLDAYFKLFFLKIDYWSLGFLIDIRLHLVYRK